MTYTSSSRAGRQEWTSPKATRRGDAGAVRPGMVNGGERVLEGVGGVDGGVSMDDGGVLLAVERAGVMYSNVGAIGRARETFPELG
jgi:hypothetical protein